MTNPNESAFPIEPGQPCCTGLTKHEYFAAMAMQGLLSNPAIIDTYGAGSLEAIASKAEFTAAALIAALNAPSEERGAVE